MTNSRRPLANSYGARLIALLTIAIGAVFALGNASAWAAPFEPNDNMLQAVGPLVGGSNHDTAMETSNDEDWFYFYTASQAQVSLKITTITSPTGKSCDDVEAELRDSAGDSVKTMYLADPVGQFDEYIWTVPGAKKYHVSIRNDEGSYGIGCAYRIVLSPAAAFTTTAPPDALAITSCKSAQSDVTTYNTRIATLNNAIASNKRKIRSTKSRIRRARGSYQRKVLRQKLRTYRKRLRGNRAGLSKYQTLLSGANAQVTQSCTPQVLELIRNDTGGS